MFFCFFYLCPVFFLVSTCSLFITACSFSSAIIHSCFQSCIHVLLHTDTCIHALTHNYSGSVLYWHGCSPWQFPVKHLFFSFHQFWEWLIRGGQQWWSRGRSSAATTRLRHRHVMSTGYAVQRSCRMDRKKEEKHLRNTSSVGKSSYSHWEV